MKRWLGVATALALAATAGCDLENDPVVIGDAPAAPLFLEVSYYAQTVHVSWELSTLWNGESFRVYSKRASDTNYVLVAEVTNCSAGVCSYPDSNVLPGVTYQYYVSAFDSGTGVETATESAVEISVPHADAPPSPGSVEVIALDDANYLVWNDAARSAADFSHYKVFLEFEGGSFLLGETDSEGFLDRLVQNGLTYTYVVTALDDQGHESAGSASASGTPRPDFHGEWVYDYFDVPASSGFRFQQSDEVTAVVDGDDPTRHFCLETDAAGWWLVPGLSTTIHQDGFITTALRCGVAADPTCVALDVAPAGGYGPQDVALFPQTTYVMQVHGDDGADHFAAIRVELLGFDQNDDAIMIFDWAYQLQAGNPQLTPRRIPHC